MTVSYSRFEAHGEGYLQGRLEPSPEPRRQVSPSYVSLANWGGQGSGRAGPLRGSLTPSCLQILPGS